MRFKVEIADTPKKLARGLMFRDDLAPDEGMLFIFDSNQPLSFWGKNTFIPLDIAFITAEGKIAHVGRIRKLSLASVRCERPCLMALEVPAGQLEKAGYGVGDYMAFQLVDGRWHVWFEKDAGNAGGTKENNVKVAQWWKSPRLHSILPFLGGKKDQKVVPKPSKPPLPQVQPPSPLESPTSPADVSLPQLVDEASEMMGEQGGQQQQQQSEMPQVSLGDISFADEDEQPEDLQVDFDGQGNPIPPQFPTPEEGEGEGEDQDGEEPIPDASSMSTMEAVQEAIENGYVMWINYLTKPKKRSIGPLQGNVRVLRIVQPHGVIHARTTGNTILVVWDMTVNDFRAFIVDRIQDKAYTGQRFKKWFAVTQ